jgi:uncharacterized protein YuzE
MHNEIYPVFSPYQKKAGPCYSKMRIKYFPDTDTALMEFSGLEVAETKEINENIYVDLDASGNLVAMTIEHARKQASLLSLSYEQIDEETPGKPLRWTTDRRR